MRIPIKCLVCQTEFTHPCDSCYNVDPYDNCVGCQNREYSYQNIKPIENICPKCLEEIGKIYKEKTEDYLLKMGIEIIRIPTKGGLILL